SSEGEESMNETEKIEELVLTQWEQHRFLVMIAAAILIACFLVSVALGLYNSSGASQVDLSRPEYANIRAQAAQDDNDKAFDSTGILDIKALQSFKDLYNARAAKVVGVDSFDAAALSEESLLLMSSDAATTNP
ncbi:MAG: hypothetical protein ABIP74_02400, partial [Candidatus Saccharimonas sp.]